MSLDDQEIIQKIRAGNPYAYAELVRKYNTRVRGQCRMMLGNVSQAEDAAQEVFIKVYESLSKFRGESAFSTWLYRITNHHCLDLLRKRNRTQTESWESLLEKKGSQMEAALLAARPAPPSEETAELIFQMLSHLPESFREILILREMQGLSYDELAQTLDCSLDAVKSRLKRAREALAHNSYSYKEKSGVEDKIRHFLKEKSV